MLCEFELYTPATIQEACQLKKQGAKIVAGGTDVYVSMHGGTKYDALADIKNIPELSGESFDEKDGLDLGCLTTHRKIETWDVIRKYYPAMFDGCSHVGAVQTRCRGTLGGNICNAVPSADSIGPMLVHDAVCVTEGPEGEKRIPLCYFFTGPKHTVLADDEILKRILVPVPAPNASSAYIKYTRRNAMDLALLGVSAYLELDGCTIKTVRIALTTSAPTPIRARKAEEYLTGKEACTEVFTEAGDITASEGSPRTSWRASKEFRLALLKELTLRVLEQAAARIGGNEQ
jgi:Aerobic-type carbon monoxide dehydrogenase, middle subunit CoxM/CutM homologs